MDVQYKTYSTMKKMKERLFNHKYVITRVTLPCGSKVLLYIIRTFLVMFFDFVYLLAFLKISNFLFNILNVFFSCQCFCLLSGSKLLLKPSTLIWATHLQIVLFATSYNLTAFSSSLVGHPGIFTFPCLWCAYQYACIVTRMHNASQTDCS